MISEKIVLQFNTEKILKSYIGGVVKNYNALVTLLRAIAQVYVIIAVNCVVRKLKFVKKTKFGKCCCCCCYCSCGGSCNLMSNSSWRVSQMQQDSSRYCKKNNNKKFFNWHHHHNDGHLRSPLLLPKKCNNLMTIAKRFASMMRGTLTIPLQQKGYYYTHSKWLPASKSQLSANQGQNPQTTTTSQVRVLPTTTRRLETTTKQTDQQQQYRNSKQYQQPTFIKSKYIHQLTAPQNLTTAAGRPLLVVRKRQQKPPQQRSFFLKNYEILSQESLEQLLQQQSALLNRTQSLNRNQLNQRTPITTTKIPRERLIQIPTTLQEEDDQEEIPTQATPVYTIISVPFLARSFLPTSCVQQKKSKKTNGLVETKPLVVNANGKEDPKKTRVYHKQQSTSAHLNLLETQRPKQLNTTTVQSLNTTNQRITRPQTQTQAPAEESSSTTSINLNTTKTPITTTSSAEMMGIQHGCEFQDLSGILQTAAVEELMAPVCFDDFFIENNNTSNFDVNKGTYKLNGLNEMAINQCNVNFAEQQQQQQQQQNQQQQQQLQLDDEEELMRNVLGNEEFLEILRAPHSEELVTLTQPSLEHETLENDIYFTTNIDGTDLITHSEDSENSSSYIPISPGSPLPTESDCISTAELHNHKYMENTIENIMQDEETSYRIEFSPQSSHEHSPIYSPTYNTYNTSFTPSLHQMPSLKRNGDHLSITSVKLEGAKKFKHFTPMLQLSAIAEGGVLTEVPDTPGICDMVDDWLSSASINSYSSSHSPGGASFAPSDLISEQYTVLEPKFENPPSVASSYICEEASPYPTPSPSNSSAGSINNYSTTNPSSPAVSVYGNGSTKKPRGRPPKQHSDLPDPDVWRKLPESERKRYEDRCKNNEASRQSRRKNKEKLMDMVAKEDHEQSKNDELRNKLSILEGQRVKLEKAVYKIFNSQ